MKKLLEYILAALFAVCLASCGKPGGTPAGTQHGNGGAAETAGEAAAESPSGTEETVRETSSAPEETPAEVAEDTFFSALAEHAAEWLPEEGGKAAVTDLDGDSLPELLVFAGGDTPDITLCMAGGKNGFTMTRYRGDYWKPLETITEGPVPAFWGEEGKTVWRLEIFTAGEDFAETLPDLPEGSSGYSLALYDFTLTGSGFRMVKAGEEETAFWAGDEPPRRRFLDGEGKPLSRKEFKSLTDRPDREIFTGFRNTEEFRDISPEEAEKLLRESWKEYTVKEKEKPESAEFLAAVLKAQEDGGREADAAQVSLTWEAAALPEESGGNWKDVLNAVSGILEDGAEEKLSSLLKERTAVDYPSGTWYAGSRIFLRRADSKAVSFLEETLVKKDLSEETSYRAVNCDTGTGNTAALGDIFRDISILPYILAREAEELYPDEGEAALQAAGADPEKLLWTMDPDGISFFLGDRALKVSPARWPAAFTGKYRFDREDAVISLCPGVTEAFADGDGNLHTVSAGFLRDSQGSMRGIRIESGGAFYEGELSALRAAPFLLRGGDGTCFLCCECAQEKDYRTLYIYGLGGEAPSLAAIEPGLAFFRGADPADEEEAAAFRGLPADSSCLWLEKQDGTKARYRISENGAPELIKEAEVSAP